MDPIDELWKAKGRGTWKALAQRMNVSPAYLSLIVKGQKSAGPKVLKALGLERHAKISYRKAS